MLVCRLQNVCLRFESKGGVLAEEELDCKAPEHSEHSMVSVSQLEPKLKDAFEFGQTILLLFTIQDEFDRGYGIKTEPNVEKMVSAKPESKEEEPR